MNFKNLHTPEGVRDIYGKEYAQKMKLEALIHKQLHLFGYRDIQTPSFEYAEVYSEEIGTTKSKDLYKFFDKQGETLVLRPDFTPSIARCAAKYFSENELPQRFCYLGNAFSNTPGLQGKLCESTQMGAELMGDNSIYADAEMIALIINCIKSTGLENFQVSIGHVAYFRGLCEAAGISSETEEELRENISGKNIFAVEDILAELSIDSDSVVSFLSMTELFGSVDILDRARKIAANEKSLDAVDRLMAVYGLLKEYGVEKYVSFDLGMLSKYHYYTGIIFKVFTYGVGDAIVKGGRYDELLGKFGKERPSVGFVVVVDELLAALNSQKIKLPIAIDNAWIIYEEGKYLQALTKATELRNEGIYTSLIARDPNLEERDYIELSKQNRICRLQFI